jgi:hypothetical protein
MRAAVGFIPNPMRPSTGVARCHTRPAWIRTADNRSVLGSALEKPSLIKRQRNARG